MKKKHVIMDGNVHKELKIKATEKDESIKQFLEDIIKKELNINGDSKNESENISEI